MVLHNCLTLFCGFYDCYVSLPRYYTRSMMVLDSIALSIDTIVSLTKHVSMIIIIDILTNTSINTSGSENIYTNITDNASLDTNMNNNIDVGMNIFS